MEKAGVANLLVVLHFNRLIYVYFMEIFWSLFSNILIYWNQYLFSSEIQLKDNLICWLSNPKINPCSIHITLSIQSLA